jgi:hypothetical protein
MLYKIPNMIAATRMTPATIASAINNGFETFLNIDLRLESIIKSTIII